MTTCAASLVRARLQLQKFLARDGVDNHAQRKMFTNDAARAAPPRGHVTRDFLAHYTQPKVLRVEDIRSVRNGAVPKARWQKWCSQKRRLKLTTPRHEVKQQMVIWTRP